MKTLIWKPDRERKKIKGQPHYHRHKNSKSIVNKLNPAVYEIDSMHDLVGFIPGMQGWLNIQSKAIETININYHINRLEGEKDMIISIEVEQPF